MPDIYLNVDTALSEVPVNKMPIISDSDFKTIVSDLNYNAAGLVLIWHFVTTAGVYTQTAVTPTDTGGNYDWVEQGNGMFTIEIPASGGASINNNAEGFGWFTGKATGVLPFCSPIFGLRPALFNDALINGTEWLPVDGHKVEFLISGVTKTVKKPDDTTTAYTKTMATDVAAVPITGSS